MSYLYMFNCNMALDIEYIERLGLVHKNVLQMLQDRGYVVSEAERATAQHDALTVGLLRMRDALRSGQSLAGVLGACYSGRQDVSGAAIPLLTVLFLDRNYDEAKQRDKMVSSEQVKTACTLWQERWPRSLCLLIAPFKLSPDAKKEAARQGVDFKQHSEMLFPVVHHCMVPRHTPLAPADAATFLRARGLQADQLPILKRSDPVASYYGLEAGTIVRVDRAGGWPVYRVVRGAKAGV